MGLKQVAYKGILILAAGLVCVGITNMGFKRNSAAGNVQLKQNMHRMLSQIHDGYYEKEIGAEKLGIKRCDYYLNGGGLEMTITNNDGNKIILKDYGLSLTLGSLVEGTYFRGVDRVIFDKTDSAVSPVKFDYLKDGESLDELFDDRLLKLKSSLEQDIETVVKIKENMKLN